jgi:hypothetical protein
MHDAPSYDDFLRKAAHVHEHVHDVHIDVHVDLDVLVLVDVGGFCSIALPGLLMMQSSTRGSLRPACDWVLLGAPASRRQSFWDQCRGHSSFMPARRRRSQEEFDMGIGFLMKYKRGTAEWIDHLLQYGAKLTRRIAEAEARGDARAVNSLIRKKNQVNRWRRSITYVGR